MRGVVPVALLVLATLPTAAGALAALPQESSSEDGREARFLVRVGNAGPLRLEADGAVRVALAPPGEEPGEWHDAPVDLVPPRGEWHGLSGVVEVVARREDPAVPLLLSATQDGSGVAWEWSARVSKPPASTPFSLMAAVVVLGVLASLAAGLALRLVQAGRRRRRT